MNIVSLGLMVVSVVLLTVAAGHDAATRSIPNWIPACLSLSGLSQRLIDGSALVGFAIGSAVFAGMFLLWVGRLIGGGDVKLLAAAVFCVPPHAVPTFLLTVALTGGLLGLLYLALYKVVRRPVPGARRSFFARVAKAEAWRISRRGPLPYGVAIAFGGVSAMLTDVHALFMR